jgi:Mrp family chromosome partitioning ATPase
MRMAELLKYVRSDFDIVLIDTPPALQISDARVLGRMMDRVIMVIRAGFPTREAAVVARQRFDEDGTRVPGTTLND